MLWISLGKFVDARVPHQWLHPTRKLKHGFAVPLRRLINHCEGGIRDGRERSGCDLVWLPSGGVVDAVVYDDVSASRLTVLQSEVVEMYVCGKTAAPREYEWYGGAGGEKSKRWVGAVG